MIKLIIMDVDGTLTDGSIYYSDDQTEIKKFNVKDAAGIMACQSVGKKCMIVIYQNICQNQEIDRERK